MQSHAHTKAQADAGFRTQIHKRPTTVRCTCSYKDPEGAGPRPRPPGRAFVSRKPSPPLPRIRAAVPRCPGKVEGPRQDPDPPLAPACPQDGAVRLESQAPNLQMRADLAAPRDSTHLAGPQLSPQHAHLGDPALARGPALFSAPHVPPHVPARRRAPLARHPVAARAPSQKAQGASLKCKSRGGVLAALPPPAGRARVPL